MKRLNFRGEANESYLWQVLNNLRPVLTGRRSAASTAAAGVAAEAAARGPWLPAAVLLSVQRATGQLEGVSPGRLLGVAAQQALVDVVAARLRQVRVGPAVEVTLLKQIFISGVFICLFAFFVI